MQSDRKPKRRKRRELPTGARVDIFERPDGSLTSVFDIEAFCKLKERQFRNGKSQALLHTVFYCSEFDHRLPEWAKDAIRNAFIRAITAGSWDEVFGRLRPKGWHRAKHKDHYELMFKIDILVARRRRNGAAVDKGLFEEVGQELGIGGTLCSELYYKFQKMVRQDADADF